MGFLKTTAIVGGIAICGAGGVLMATNPDRAAYEQYAVDRLSTYLQSDVCTDTPGILGEFEGVGELIEHHCQTLVQNHQSELATLVANSTTQTNLFVVTIYRTNLKIPGVAGLPGWQFETLGIFQRFITYKAAQV